MYRSKIFFLIFPLFILLFFFNRGFAYYDEGFILHASQRLLNGEIPYRDFDLIYTPLTVLLTAGTFSLLGESVFTGRFLSLLVSWLTCYLVYKLVLKETVNKQAAILAGLIYLAWGPTHINFPWPSIFALTGGVVTLFVLPNLFLSGLLTAVVFFTKQNFGITVFLSLLMHIFLTYKKERFAKFRIFLTGSFCGLLVFFLYFLLTDSLQVFLNNFYFYTVQKFLLEGAVNTSFPTGLKAVIYIFPGFISLLALIIFRNKKDKLLLPAFVLFFYLFGIRPTTDYPHLAVLMSAVGIPLGLILSKYRETSESRQRLIFLFLGILLCGLGFYTALFKNYYRWDSPLVKQNFYLKDKRTKIFVDTKFSQAVPEILSELNKYSRADDYIFIFPNAPLFYFLTDLKNPTRYLNLPNNLHSEDQEREIITDLQGKKVKLILANESVKNSDYEIIKKYILANFQEKKTVEEFSIWVKK